MDEKAIRGIPWTLMTFGATKVVGVLTTIVLARLLAPADFGLFALATLATSLLSIFNGNWLGATVIVNDDMDDRSRGTVLTLLLVSGALMAAALAAVAPLAAAALHQPRLEPMLFVFAVILLFSGVNWFYEKILQRELEFRRRFVAQVGRTVTFSTVALALGATGAGVWSLVAAQVLGHVANGVLLFCLAPYRVRPAFDMGRARRIVRSSRGFLGQELAEFFEQNIDYIAVGQVLGASQLGFYSMSYRQADLPRVAIADPVTTVTFPAFARMHQEGKDVSHAFLTAIRLACLVICPIGIVLSAGCVPFVEALFGPRWLPMTGPLAVMGIWAIARSLQVMIGRLLNSLGAAWLYGRISSVGVIPFAIAVVLSAKLGGITAVAWVLLVYMVVLSALLMRVIARHAGIPVAAQWHVLWPVLLASVTSWLVTRATADMLGGWVPFANLTATTIACLAAYSATLLIADRELLVMAVRQGRRVLTPKRAAAAAS
jgi:PST family polysaccharide transporter